MKECFNINSISEILYNFFLLKNLNKIKYFDSFKNVEPLVKIAKSSKRKKSQKSQKAQKSQKSQKIAKKNFSKVYEKY